MSSGALGNITRTQVLGLYRRLIRGGQRYPDYNFSQYILRRTRDRFHAAINVRDPAEISKLYQAGLHDLGVVERQGIISGLYAKAPRVIGGVPKMPQ